jgi:hypothetical protein
VARILSERSIQEHKLLISQDITKMATLALVIHYEKIEVRFEVFTTAIEECRLLGCYAVWFL